MAGKGKQVNNKRNLYRQGPFGGKLSERAPILYGADGESIYAGENNTWIVLGRDRNGSIFGDSYGALGASEAGAIDIVVGRSTDRPSKFIDPITRKETYSYNNPNFETDAARLYISQKSDIDRYIGLQKYSRSIGLSSAKSEIYKEFEISNGKSAAALISDHTRIVGRESVKIATKYYQKNSRGSFLDLGGIDIIAHGRVDDRDHILHPMVRGDNLVIALEKLAEFTDNIAGILGTFLNFQMKFNNKVINHKHIQGPPRNPITWQSQLLKTSAIKDQINLLVVTQKELMTYPGQFLANFYTECLADTGESYINSLWNRVN
jgi:hypothetical protein